MTYRERREAKAERLRQWADKREEKADHAREQTDQLAGLIPFGQPILVGHHSEKRHRRDLDRIDRGMRAQVENGCKADEMRSRADNIERAAKRAIYSDDVDAVERLEAKIDKLEAQRETVRETNASYRKAHKAELKDLGPYHRDQAMPYPAYVLRNLGGNISQSRKRLAQLECERANGGPADRIITARHGGSCEECCAAIQPGDQIRYSRQAGARCVEC